MRTQIVLLGALCVLILAAAGKPASGLTQATVTPSPSVTALPSPPPPPTAPAAPDVSGTWDVTRSWFRRCSRCGEPVIRGTTWQITQNGHELRVDRGLRGSIEGYNIQLEGLETDGFDRFDFYYSRLYLSPDGLRITGEFVGSETVQNPCAPSPPIVTCFASAGYLHAIRRSPHATLPPPPPPGPPVTETTTPTETPTPISSTPTGTPSPTQPAHGAAAISSRYLPFITRPIPPGFAPTP
ncbi:MAG: hypothetical protein ACE5HA_05585 [Anaerolineae bacterium]